jgi:hypothetical protein
LVQAIKHNQQIPNNREPDPTTPKRRIFREGNDADANFQTSASSGSGVCGATSTRFVISPEEPTTIEMGPILTCDGK